MSAIVLMDNPTVASITSHLKTLLQDSQAQSAAIARVYSFLMLVPADYLSRGLRNLSMAKAYEWDLQLARGTEFANASMLLRRYLSKIIRETGYIGGLVSTGPIRGGNGSNLPYRRRLKI
jgi:hypothetical protein